MPLKVRCPHCKRVLLAEDDTAGQRRLCPVCYRPFEVPQALQEDWRRVEVAQTCPRCKAEVAPGTTICQRCLTDIRSGKRLPLPERIRRTSARTRLLVGGSVGVGLLVAYIVAYVALTNFQQRAEPDVRTSRSAIPAFAADEWSARLFSATDPEARAAARDKLMHGGRQSAAVVVSQVAQRLADALQRDEAAHAEPANLLAAVDVLAAVGPLEPDALPGLLTLLAEAETRAPLRTAALRARGMLGDAAAADALVAAWLEHIRTRAFLTRLGGELRADEAPALEALRNGARHDAERMADGLVQLLRKHEPQVLAAVLEPYWQTWAWLGQARGEVWSTEVFDLIGRAARPDGVYGFEADKQAIRGARDALTRFARDAHPLARAAAGIVLVRGAPQYHSARERIVDAVIEALPSSDPATQQRLTWAAARLTGRQFGDATADTMPHDVAATDVQALLRWAEPDRPAPSDAWRNDASATAVPRLVRRVVPPRRQLERDLLDRLQAGWSEVEAVLQRWIREDLGATPRLLRHLDPTQRAPHYPALATAMAVVAHNGTQRARQALSLWRTAADQPAWVRELAFMTLGALDAQAGTWQSDWPAELTLSLDDLPPDAPGWSLCGAVLASGGQPMRERLALYNPPPLDYETQERLFEAARQAKRRFALDED